MKRLSFEKPPPLLCHRLGLARRTCGSGERLTRRLSTANTARWSRAPRSREREGRGWRKADSGDVIGKGWAQLASLNPRQVTRVRNGVRKLSLLSSCVLGVVEQQRCLCVRWYLDREEQRVCNTTEFLKTVRINRHK